MEEGTQLIVQDAAGEAIAVQVGEEPPRNSGDIVEQAFHVSTTIEEEDGGTAMLVSARGMTCFTLSTSRILSLLCRVAESIVWRVRLCTPFDAQCATTPLVLCKVQQSKISVCFFYQM